MENQQKDQTHSHTHVYLANPSAMKGTSVWPYDTDPSVDLFVDNNKYMAKTSADSKYFGLTDDGTIPSNDELNTMIKNFVSDYVDNFNYVFQNLQVTDEPVSLHNGQVVQTKRFEVSLDLSQAKDTLVYALENLAQSQELANLVNAFEKSAGQSSQDSSNLDQVKAALDEMINSLKTADVNEWKAMGMDGSLHLNFWINPDTKDVVQQDATFTFTDPSLSTENLPLTLHITTQTWNQNQPVVYDQPNESQIAWFDSSFADPTPLFQFEQETPIRMILNAQLQPFDDVDTENYAYTPIYNLKQKGMIDGYDNNEFRPQGAITRAEFIKMTVNALGLTEDTSANLTFKDKEQIQDWAVPYIQTAVQSGLIHGYLDGTLHPNQSITRAEMVKILVAAANLSINENYTLSYTDTDMIPAWALPYVKAASENGLINGYDGRFASDEHATRAQVATVLDRMLTNQLQ